MKTTLFTSILVTMLFAGVTFGQDVTTVTATNYDISDNLDLTAVASIFGESKDLADFEYRLNNPKTQISNLDLNRDGQVDYLRVIESIERNTHLIVIQSVLGRDLYQDVATIEVEKDTRNNRIQVQVVGDVFLYGNNYIYEPVYYVRPIIFNTFWTRSYVAYYSPWYWGYYPTYFSYWRPYPIFRYRTHVHTYVNVYNTYNYVDARRSSRAVAMHNSVRSNAYERQNPNQSFARRNDGVRNSYALNQTRSTMNTGSATRSNATRTDNASRNNSTANLSNNNTRSSATVGNSSGNTRSISVTTSSSTRSSSVGTSSNNTRNSSVTTGSSTRSSSVGTSSNNNRNSAIIGNSSQSRSTSVSSPSSTSRGTSVGTSSSGTRSSSMTSPSPSSSRSSATMNSSSSRSSSVGNTNSRSSSNSTSGRR